MSTSTQPNAVQQRPPTPGAALSPSEYTEILIQDHQVVLRGFDPSECLEAVKWDSPIGTCNVAEEDFNLEAMTLAEIARRRRIARIKTVALAISCVLLGAAGTSLYGVLAPAKEIAPPLPVVSQAAVVAEPASAAIPAASAASVAASAASAAVAAGQNNPVANAASKPATAAEVAAAAAASASTPAQTPEEAALAAAVSQANATNFSTR